MRLLVTGATGMVGRNVLEHPRAADFDILAPTRAELDLLDRAAVLDYLRKTGPDLIVHTAGTVGGIMANVREPVRFLLENFEIGRNVIHSALECRVPELINLGSSCMYPRDVPGLINESMLLAGPLEPTNEGYALAKISMARLCEYITRGNPGMFYRTLVPCNLYGRWDHFNTDRSHLMAAAITKVVAAVNNGVNNVEIWGSGTPRREFLYSADLADAIFWASDRLDSLPSLLNIGSGVDHTIYEYYQAISTVAGYKGRFTLNTARPDGMMRKLMDVSVAAALGWRAQTRLEQGLRATLDFYAEHASG